VQSTGWGGFRPHILKKGGKNEEEAS